MKSGNKSRIEVSPDTGRKSLIDFYNSETDDFDEARGAGYLEEGGNC
jgi:hypothetical protein